MEENERLMHRYKLLEDRFRSFILIHSDVEYVQGSSEIVEGGAFIWSELSPESKKLQLEIWRDYLSVSRHVRKCLVQNGGYYLDLFDQSHLEIKSCLKQNSMLWGSCLKDVFVSMKKELDLQRSLLASLMIGQS